MNTDSLPIRLWRDTFKLNLSQSWKADVDKTVTDLKLWKSILAQWKREKRHPGIKGLLDEYERREFDAIQQKGNGVYREEGISERATRILFESGMPSLLDRTRM